MNLRHAFLLPALPILHAISADQTWISGNANNDWNTTAGLNWDAGVAWTQGNNAIFGGTGETVTLTEGITVGDITFNVATFTLSGNTLTLGASTLNTAVNATINSILAGGSLNKTGAGTLTLGGANSYSGGTTWADGSLTITNGSAFGTGLLNITKTTAGTLTVANTAATTVANAITLPAPGVATTYTVVKNSSGQLTGTVLNLTGDIGGGNANDTLFFNSSTAGDSTTTYRLAGNNTFRATLRVNRGALVVASATGLGDPANQVVLDSNNNFTLGNLRFDIPMTVANPVNLLSTGPIGTGANDVVLSGVVSGAAVLTKSGTGRLTLTNAANTHTGGITINEGTFTLSGAGRLNSGAYAGAIINNTALEIDTTATQSLTGLISGAGTLTKSNATGILNLGNTGSTFSGPINITAGQVRATATSAGATGSLGTGPITIANGAALHFFVPTGTTSTFANNIQLPSTGSQQFIISAPSSATTVRLTGQLTGGTAGQTYRLVDSNAGSNHNNVLVLDNAANNFQGTIEMWRGTLGFTSDAALGNADNDIRHYTENLNGSLRFDADNITLNPLRTITLVSASVMPFNTQSYTGTVDGVITGPGQLIKQGSGTLVLTAANTFTGPVVINAGAVSVATLADGGANSPIGKSVAAATGLVLGGGTLRYTGSSVSIDRAFTLTAATIGAIEVTAPGTNLTLSGGTAATTGSLNKTGPGTLTLTGVNAHTGNTTASEGTLYLENIQSAGIISVSSTATLGGGGQTGDVDMLNGGFLLPGSAGRADNWLQVGNLSLAGTTELQFELDAPDNGGAALAINDLVIAASTPFLGGVVNVTPLGVGFTGAAPGSKWKLIELTAGTVPAHNLTLAPALASGYSLEAVEGSGAVYLVAVPEAGTATLLLLSGLLLRGIGLRKHGKG